MNITACLTVTWFITGRKPCRLFILDAVFEYYEFLEGLTING